MSVNIPISANASAAVAALNDIREAVRRSGQEMKALADIDLSHPELANVTAELARMQQQVEEMQRLSKGRAPNAVRNLNQIGAAGGTGFNPVGNQANQDDLWERLFPDPAERTRVRTQAVNHAVRNTPLAPPPPPPPGGGAAPAAPSPALGVLDMLKGPAGIMLGLAGVGSIAGMISSGFGRATEESGSNDQLMRRTSDLGTDFDHLREKVRAASDGTGLLHGTMQKLTLDYGRVTGTGQGDDDAKRVQFGAKLARGFGADAATVVGLQSRADASGVSPRELAKLITDAAGQGQMSGNIEGAMSAIVRWTESSTRSGVGQHSAAEFTKLYTGMTGSGNTGLRQNAEGIISTMDAAAKAGGGGGRASEAVTYRAFAANGTHDVFEQARLQEKGMFGNTRSNGTGETIYDAVNKQIDRLYPGASRERLYSARGRHWGTGAEVQKQLDENLERGPGGMDRMAKLLKDAGINQTKIEGSAYGELAKLSRSDADLQGMRTKMLAPNSGYGITTEQGTRLTNASGEELRNEIARVLAANGGQKTEATNYQDASAKMTNAITETMTRLIEPVTMIKIGVSTVTDQLNKVIDLLTRPLGQGDRLSQGGSSGGTAERPDIGTRVDENGAVQGMPIAWRGGQMFRLPGGAGGFRLPGGGGGGGGGAGGPTVTGEIDPTLTAEARGLLRTIMGTESPGYNVRYGGARFSDMSRHPNVAERIRSGPNAGQTSTAAGGYQFLKPTWDEAAAATGAQDFGSQSQDKGAWWLAQRDYHARTRRNLAADLSSTDPRVRAGIGPALSKTWTSMPGGIEAGTTNGRFLRELDRNTANQRQSATPVPPADRGARQPGVTNIGFQIAPLRVVHENSRGEETHQETMPVARVGQPMPYGIREPFFPVERQGPTYQPGVAMPARIPASRRA